jgi:hypothetical protein
MSVDELVGHLLSPLGGAVIVLSGLFGFLGSIWSNRISRGETHQLQRDLEQLKGSINQQVAQTSSIEQRLTEAFKSEIQRDHEFFVALVKALPAGFSTAHPRVLDNLSGMWDKILETRQLFKETSTIYELLLPEEFAEALDGGRGRHLLPKVSENDFVDRFTEIFGDVERLRLFSSDRLWSLFTAHRIFSNRISLKVVRAVNASGVLYEWDKSFMGEPDTALKSILDTVFTEDELRIIITESRIGVPGRILDSLEAKILVEMREWLFGIKLIDMNLAEQQRILSAITQMQRQRAGLEPTIE